MTLDEITQAMRDRVGESAGMGKSVTFDFGDDGVIRLDDTETPVVVDNTRAETNATIKMSKDTFEEITAGSLNAQTAMMTGKIVIEGDMGVAMQLGRVLS